IGELHIPIGVDFGGGIKAPPDKPVRGWQFRDTFIYAARIGNIGRRGLHNDGADLLRERLTGKIEIDTNTSRRLFTLICVLHIRA
ncbi:MAG: hypothetical protein Dbin4_02884, partial [Alphaproteobacteria bacterium]|nr:hypothetical protein [Alphaproteobacteria bacterium]